MYDNNNIFAKILRGEIPCTAVYEDEFALAFYDINPQAPVHILVIPKGAYEDFSDFAARAGDEEIAGYFRAINNVIKQEKLVENGGYRLLMNTGADSGQEVPHLHTHIFAGGFLGRMINMDSVESTDDESQKVITM